MTHRPTNWTSRICLILALGLALGICDKAKAEGVIGVHTLSAHIPQHNQMNQNWGAYIRSADQVEAGIYRNSFNRTGVYVAKGFNLTQGPAGTLGVQVGLVSGYKRECTRTYATAPGKHHSERHEDGSSASYSEPDKVTWSERCEGFSRGAITPLAGFTYTAPGAIMGVTPRLQFVPGLKGHSSVVHLTLEAKWN